MVHLCSTQLCTCFEFFWNVCLCFVLRHLGRRMRRPMQGSLISGWDHWGYDVVVVNGVDCVRWVTTGILCMWLGGGRTVVVGRYA